MFSGLTAMCGIAGVFAYGSSAPPVDHAELLRTRDAMARRGPDGSGIWLSADGTVGLAHRRLAIIDLSERGAQPLATDDGRLHITFNGEIYNYKALRQELEAKGVRFRTDTDTEVLLHLYADRGAQLLQALRGMYAFAIWDSAERRLFLARDPFGIKPLYLADDGKTLRFASQVKALVAGGQVSSRPEPAGEVGFYLWGAVPEPYTLYSAVRALPSGSSVTYQPDQPGAPQPFFSLREELLHAEGLGESTHGRESLVRLQEAFRDTVRHHLVADVPVAVFLSAGLDSMSIAGVAAEIGGSDLRTLTLGFSEYQGSAQDETALAAEGARTYGTRHETHVIPRADFERALPDILQAMDQPSTDGVNTYFVAWCARQAGMKVALSGLGGDEMLGGYPSFRQVPKLAAGLGAFQRIPRLGRAFRRLTGPWIGALASPKAAGVLEYGSSFAGAYLLRRALFMPWELGRLFAPETLEAGLEELRTVARVDESISDLQHPAQRMAALELQWYMRNQLLRDADWAGMAHSVEIRVPFVDVGFFRVVAQLLAGGAPGKQGIATAPTHAMPVGVTTRAKTGFVAPVREWTASRGARRQGARGLRAWAQSIHHPSKPPRILALVTDAFGGHGGIALYGRDLLTALTSSSQERCVTGVPRLAPMPLQGLPGGLRYITRGVNSKWRFTATILRLLLCESRQYDLVICGHINLLPVGLLAKAITRAPMALFIYGIDAWQPIRSPLARLALRNTERVVSISSLTLDRFLAWSRFARERTTVLSNAIHLNWYSPGPRDPALVARYGLRGKRVLMTLGRMVSKERYKGFDEVMEALPLLPAEYADVSYLVVGDGSDQARLRRKAAGLGLGERVVFAGRIKDEEKADHYRLADAFLLPSQGEGFGFVLLEAMACGVPVVASALDGGREAVREGQLGILVDPRDRTSVVRGIREALARPRAVPAGLEYFSFDRFRERVDGFIDVMLR